MITALLLIEEDTSLRDDMKDFLECNGYHCLLANNRMDGVFKAMVNFPDIIIYDTARELNNFSAKNESGAVKYTTDSPYLFLAAKKVDDYDDELLFNEDESITRPFQISELTGSIRRWFDKNCNILIRVRQEQPLFHYVFAN